jgi:hypothetical protein
MITQAKLKELFHYCPDTGIFTWLVSAGCVKAGAISGSKNSRGYLLIRIGGVRYLSHRLAFLYMNGEFPPRQVDHINGVRVDNRWANLRPVTNSENQRNSKMRENNTSGHIGVSWHKATSKWQACYGIGGRLIYIGLFADISVAIAARAAVAHLFHENHGRVA